MEPLLSSTTLPGNEPADTPMMQQYHQIKKQHPGCLLFFRMGDFYEMFFEDAIQAAGSLGITLTKRGKHNGEDIPMCGVPVINCDHYLQRLVKAGFRIAICEQLEDPQLAKKRGNKSIVKRDVVRIITRGTLTEDTLLENRTHNFLVSIIINRNFKEENNKEQNNKGQNNNKLLSTPKSSANLYNDDTIRFGVAYADISTGEFWLEEVKPQLLNSCLYRLQPKEILIEPELISGGNHWANLLHDWDDLLTPFVPATIMRNGGVGSRLQNHPMQNHPAHTHNNANNNGDPTEAPDNYIAKSSALVGSYSNNYAVGYNQFYQFLDNNYDMLSPHEISSARRLLAYLESTQKGECPRLNYPQRRNLSKHMEIDAATMRNLEIISGLQGDEHTSLLYNIDYTATSAGARLLSQRLRTPLNEVEAINNRLDLVTFFINQPVLLQEVLRSLKQIPDTERILARLSLGRAGPRDVKSLVDSFSTQQKIISLLKNYINSEQSLPQLLDIILTLATPIDCLDQIRDAFAEDVPFNARDGGFIRSGFSSELDNFRLLQNDSKKIILQMQENYCRATGISTLKIRHNNIIGYHIEVPASQAEKMLQANFIHRQTLANNARFTTLELGEIEKKIISAHQEGLVLELRLFSDIVNNLSRNQNLISKHAKSLAEIDVAISSARLASKNNYTRPEVTKDLSFVIEGGRHPVVEIIQKNTTQETFIKNNCDLCPEQRLWLLTGPNMAGKSTFLRQNAIIAIMAQAGCYVPANYARIGIVDRVFSRVGAADDLARGRSTFMVEMNETALILNYATPRSLVILDEIGRGTSTYDGLAIAWATLEYIHNNNLCRGLFATHYHELTKLCTVLAALKCYTMKIKEWNDQIVLLHEVVPGVSNRSFGVQVAALAGIPAPVIERAKSLLDTLEQGLELR